MTGLSSSLASLLAYPDASQAHAAARGHPGAEGHGDDEGQALLSYLRDHYTDDDDGRSGPQQHRSTRNTGGVQALTFRQRPANTSLHPGGSVTELLSFSSPRRSPSPPDPRIAISPALAELATTAPALDIPPIAPVAVNEANLLPDDSEMRGEMGGKRRKAPHERAGWKEMDEQRDWKRTRKKRGSSDAIQDFVGYSGPGTGAGTLESDLIEAHGEMGLPGELPSTEGTTVALLDPQLVGQGEGEDEGAKSADGAGAKGEKAAVDSKNESRAEQNRRAQQAFRRRREEHIKKLGSDAAALEPTRRRLDEAEYQLREFALSLEASKIETSALRAALRTVAITSGASILTLDGTLVINASSSRRETASRSEDIEEAYAVLERQARELAKQSRAKREA